MELAYFAIPALAEPARMVLALGELEWKDDRFGFGEWADRKPSTKWGQVDGKALYPEDPVKAALVDDIGDFMIDIHRAMYTTMSLPADQKEKARQDLVAPGAKVSELLKLLEANVGEYAVGDSLTLADLLVFWYPYFLICGFWDGLSGRADLVLDPYPKIKAIGERVKALPKLKEYYTKIAADNDKYKVFCA